MTTVIISRPDRFGIRQVTTPGVAVAVIGLAEAFAVRRALEEGSDPHKARGASGRSCLPYDDCVRHDLGGVTREVYRRRLRTSRHRRRVG